MYRAGQGPPGRGLSDSGKRIHTAGRFLVAPEGVELLGPAHGAQIGRVDSLWRYAGFFELPPIGGGQWQIHAPLATGYKPTSDSLGEANRSVTVIDPAGYDEAYRYDALNGGRLVSYTPGNGDAPQAFGYDMAGFVNQTTDSDGNIVSFTNDIHGNVLSRTWFPVGPASSGAAASTTREGPQAAAASSSCTTTGTACTAHYSYYTNPATPFAPRNNEQTAARDARSASATDNTYLTSSASIRR